MIPTPCHPQRTPVGDSCRALRGHCLSNVSCYSETRMSIVWLLVNSPPSNLAFKEYWCCIHFVMIKQMWEFPNTVSSIVIKEHGLYEAGQSPHQERQPLGHLHHNLLLAPYNKGRDCVLFLIKKDEKKHTRHNWLSFLAASYSINICSTDFEPMFFKSGVGTGVEILSTHLSKIFCL